jgi:hypothetical protein
MYFTPAYIRQYLERRRISVWAVATRLKIDPGHLRRVLSEQRKGSAALLESVVEAAATMRGRRQHEQEDTDRLLEAAVHVFFLERGDFESAIFADPEEMGLYGPGPTKKKANQALKKKEGECQT